MFRNVSWTEKSDDGVQRSSIGSDRGENHEDGGKMFWRDFSELEIDRNTRSDNVLKHLRGGG